MEESDYTDKPVSLGFDDESVHTFLCHLSSHALFVRQSGVATIRLFWSTMTKNAAADK
jgi:hypothetical protein